MAPDDNAGTPPQGDAASAAGTQPAPSTPAVPDEVTTLRNRQAGLDAKVTELQKQAAKAQADAAAAAAKLADYEAGKVGADEALRAQLQAKEAELAEVRRQAALTRIEAKYPETFGVLGEAAAHLTEDQLAASEARMSGAGTGEASRPLGANPARTVSSAPKPVEDMTAAELRAHLRTYDPAVMTAPRT